MIRDITTIAGFILALLGGAGLESNGFWIVVAVAMVLFGCLLMYIGGAEKEDYYGKSNRRG